LDKLRSQYWFAICAGATTEHLATIAKEIWKLEEKGVKIMGIERS